MGERAQALRSRPASASRSLTACPPPNLRVSQSSISLSKAFKSTRKLASIRPSATGRVSSKAEKPVKLRMQKLSSQATGQSLGPSGSKICTLTLRANIIDPVDAGGGNQSFAISSLEHSWSGSDIRRAQGQGDTR